MYFQNIRYFFFKNNIWEHIWFLTVPHMSQVKNVIEIINNTLKQTQISSVCYLSLYNLIPT